MKLLNAGGLTRTTLLAISASLLATLIMPREVSASDGDDPTVLSQVIVPPGIERPEVSASDSAVEKRANRLKHSYDAGDFYYYQGERMPLRRSLTELVVEFKEDVCEERKRDVIDSTVLDAKLADGGRVRGRPVSRVELVEPLTAATLDETLAAVRGWPEVKYAFPVFVHPQNGGAAALTDELIVKLRSGVELEAVTTIVGPDTLTAVKKVWGTDDQYILRVNAPKRVSPLQIANQLAESAPVDWASPNILQKVHPVFTPSDPLYPQQWHLNNEGELEAYLETSTSGDEATDLELHSPADADVDAPEAWDMEQGSEDIVIAILDSGVDLEHEDLVSDLFVNEGEIPGNGIDDDGNGFIDDVRGWDFFDNDNVPHDEDGHGTAVAGIAAASTDNAVGIAGICPRCRILPVRFFDDASYFDEDEASIAEAIRYAASLADVLNGSWMLDFPHDLIASAFQDATTVARNGKGVISLFASGNSAARFRPPFSVWESPGIHRYRLTYTKDEDGSVGEDTAWLAWVAMPDGEVVTFEDGVPEGWETSGDAPWSVVEDPLHADESICQIHALKAGDIDDGEQSHLDIIVEHEGTNRVWFFYWISSEYGSDGLEFYFDRWNDGTIDKDYGWASGWAPVKFDLFYPASLPETVAVGASSSWDCRSGYSQFGADLDFLAPSAGYVLSTYMTSTNPTADAGYFDTSYFIAVGSGTSLASPIAAGIAGLILSAAPELTAEEVRQLMRDTADKIGPEPYFDGRNDRYGYGRVNAHRALAALAGEQTSADLVLTKTADDDRVRLYEELSYKITVTNEGPAAATNVTVTDTLPQELNFEEASDDCAFNNGILVCSIASIEEGEREEFEFKGIVSQVPADRLLINQATVTADQVDGTPGNNTAEAVSQVIGRASSSDSED